MIVRTWAKATLWAFHTDRTGGAGRHSHLWTVAACRPADPEAPADVRDLEHDLRRLLAPLQGCDLPDHLFSVEALAAHVLLQLEPAWLGVKVTREGLLSDADAWRA